METTSRATLRNPKKDAETVTADGQSVSRRIEGVVIQPAVTHADERGTLCQVSSLALAANPAPLVYVYQYSIRPGMTKGWHIHYLHDDRIFLSRGNAKLVLFDNRPESPTYRMVNEIHWTEHHRSLIVIPANVYHANQNIGDTEAFFISMPTKPYDHANPDVYRLPLDTDEIPYKFERRIGW